MVPILFKFNDVIINNGYYNIVVKWLKICYMPKNLPCLKHLPKAIIS